MSLSQVSECLSCQHELGLDWLLPHLAAVTVETAGLGGRQAVHLDAGTRGKRWASLSVAVSRRGCTVLLSGDWPMHWSAASQRCSGWRSAGCAAGMAAQRSRFAEQAGGLTSLRARRTPPLADARQNRWPCPVAGLGHRTARSGNLG